MRALVAAFVAAGLLTSGTAAQAKAGHRLTGECTTVPVEVLLDEGGVAAVYTYAVANGPAREVSTRVHCTVEWSMSSPGTIEQSAPGPVAAGAASMLVSGSPYLCVQAAGYWSDGVRFTTSTVCADRTSVRVEESV
jgi:hypothetical protein